MNVHLSNRDVIALALAAGVKIGGGTYVQAFAWGFGARILMRYLGFPEQMQLGTPAQSFVQDLSQLWQRATGAPLSEQPAAAPAAEPDNVIDADYQEHGYASE